MQGLFALAERLGRGSRWTYALLSCLWAVLIFSLSATSVGASGPKHPARSWAQNLAHAPEFGVLAVLTALALRERRSEAPRASLPWASRWLRAALVLTVLYGATDEIHQGTVAGRDGSICDLATDLAGAWTALEVLAASILRDRERLVRKLALGLLACMFTALLATFLGDMFPKWTWL